MANPVLEAALAELAAAGAEVLSIEKNKHVKVRFRHRGKKFMTVIPISASDHRAALNQIEHLRKMVGKDHLPVRADKGERRVRKAKAPPRELAEPVGVEARPDWRDALARLKERL